MWHVRAIINQNLHIDHLFPFWGWTDFTLTISPICWLGVSQSVLSFEWGCVQILWDILFAMGIGLTCLCFLLLGVLTLFCSL